MQQTRPRSTPSRAFTLIELLVVVAIISLLISILLPSLSGARKQSLQVLCVTNLRSLGQAAQLYAADNRNTVVRAESQVAAAPIHYAQTLVRGLGYDGPTDRLWRPNNYTVQKPLMDLCRTLKPFQCPSFPPHELDPNEQSIDYVVSAFALPYTQNNVNSDAAGGGQPGEDYMGSTNQGGVDYEIYYRLDRFTGLANPSRMIYLTEAHRKLPVNTLVYHDLYYTSQLPLGAHPRVASDQRHPRGITALFFDGHAVAAPIREIDSGWPTTIAQRLSKFTFYPEQ